MFCQSRIFSAVCLLLSVLGQERVVAHRTLSLIPLSINGGRRKAITRQRKEIPGPWPAPPIFLPVTGTLSL